MPNPRPLRKIAIIMFALALSLSSVSLVAAGGGQPDKFTGVLNDISFPASSPGSTGWAVGNDSVGNADIVYQAPDTTWNIAASFHNTRLNSIVMLTPNSGYAVGNGGAIYGYDGHKWKQVKNGPTNQNLHRVKADASGLVFAVGDNGTAIAEVGGGGGHSDGGGWFALPTAPGNPTLYGGAILSDGNGGYNGYAVGAGGAILEFVSATYSWTTITSPTTNDLSDVNLSDANNGFATTFNGQVVTYASGSWTLNATLGMTNNGVLDLRNHSMNPNHQRTSGAGRFDLTGVTAIVVGNSGGTGMIGLDRSGRWATNPIGQGITLNYLTQDASGNVYAVGSGGTIIPIQ